MEEYKAQPISDAAWLADDDTAKRPEVLKQYGLSAGQYAEMLIRQRNCCPICHREFDLKVKPVIDHCHTTGAVRGILCTRCNVALGGFKDSPLFVRNALFYLTRGRIEYGDLAIAEERLGE